VNEAPERQLRMANGACASHKPAGYKPPGFGFQPWSGATTHRREWARRPGGALYIYKSELIYPQEPWPGLDEFEFATLGYIE
jgi:hypothetical protein